MQFGKYATKNTAKIEVCAMQFVMSIKIQNEDDSIQSRLKLKLDKQKTRIAQIKKTALYSKTGKQSRLEGATIWGISYE